MQVLFKIALAVNLLMVATVLPLRAQEADLDGMAVRQLTESLGQMDMALESGDGQVYDSIRFEPYQGLFDLFGRDDVVYLMRHGPTDWTRRDMANVAPTDCANQRIMTELGRSQMRDFGRLLGSNKVVPAQIVVSQWCRNQQTVESLLQGYADIDATVAENIPVETDPSLNLLLSLQGAPTTAVLEERISSWQGDPGRKGPLLLISHYTNIEELTQFRVFEGEILVLDPKRENRVLGYIRLKSTAPDVGHFADALDTPFDQKERAFEIMEQYYGGLNNRDFSAVRALLDDYWYEYSGGTEEPRDADLFFDDIRALLTGMPDARFDVLSLHFAGGTVTVVGNIVGTHTGELFGVAGTNRTVSVGALAVHSIYDGKIFESRQMLNTEGLLDQIR